MTNNQQKSFTLIEILVYIAVLSIIIVAVSSFTLWSVYSNTKAKTMRDVLYNGERAMETMTSEIKEAGSIYIPTTTSAQLSLEVMKYLPAGEESTYIDFYLCGDQLCFKKESQDPITLTSSNVQVSNLEFTRIGTTFPSIQIALKIDYKNPQDRREYRSSVELKSAASLRGY